MIKPQKLQKWDLIWIVSPSAWLWELFPHRIENWVKMLEKLWYRVKLWANSFKRNWYVSSSVEDRVAELHDMFADKEVKAIICTIWWNHSNQIIKHLDYDLIASNPKIFMGYSDITVLHYAISSKTWLQTYYGPCLMTQFWEYPEITEYSLECFRKAVESDEPIWEIKQSDYYIDEILNWFTKDDLTRPRERLETSWYEWWKKWKATGEVFGWAIPSVNHLLWTEFWVDHKDKIFFIDIPEWNDINKGLDIDWLDSYLADLDNAWVFSVIKWLIIWRPYKYSDEEIGLLKEIVLSYTAWKDYPILFNANIWHVDPIITLPLRSNVTLDSEENRFVISDK